MKRNNIHNLSLSAMFLALTFLLPLLTGQIPQLGERFCPMHLPVFLCGYLCSGPWGLAVGFIAPLLRSVTVGVPAPFFPKAFSIAFELAAYGFISGSLYRLLPKKKSNLYLSLVVSMVLGRLVRGFVQLCCVGLDVTEYTFSAFWTVSVVNALPGIIIQLLLIPVLVTAAEKYKSKDR
ncbi:MAG: ECF transporter S component [Ruminococcaceae bacterium]|nr:ECF transporter S component [Oscillospiraceae bacterium]MBQ9912667.1 ECF transporter S component [Clostridia bacterium]